MSVKIEHIRQFVIQPTLLWMSSYLNDRMSSKQAMSQILATICHESLSGHYLNQVTGTKAGIESYGAAAGICMIEKPTLESLMNYASKKMSCENRNKSWLTMIREHFGEISMHALRYNLAMNVCFCRLKYWTIRAKLPPDGNLVDIANYWGKWYQTDSKTTLLDNKEMMLIRHCMQQYPDYYLNLNKMNERFVNLK